MNKNLSIFLYAQVLSSFGYNLLFSAINFYALDLTGSPIRFANVMLLGILSKAIFLQFAGMISDTFDKKRTFILIDIFYIILSLLLLLGSFNDSFGYLMLIMASFAINAIRSISQPVTKTLIPAIVEDKSLLKANSYEVSNDKLGRIFGPSVALALQALFGFRATLIFSLSIYVLTFYLKRKLVINVEKMSYNSTSFRDILQKFRDGFAITFSNKSIFILLVNAILTQIFFHSFIYTALPSMLHGLNEADLVTIKGVLSFVNMTHAGIWKTLNSWIQLGGAIGVLLSIFVISRNRDVNERKGLSWGNFGISLFGLLFSASIILFKYFNLSTLTLVNLLFLSNVGLVFCFNIFTIFFSLYYQRRIDKGKLGRFAANFMFLFAISSLAGTGIYGISSTYGWHYSTVILVVGSILKFLVHLIFLWGPHYCVSY